MTGEAFRLVLSRELETLRGQLRAYGDDEQIWIRPAGAPNSAGNLALHLCGNLQHFVGAVLGQTGYVRDREREFTARDLPRATLEADIDAAREALSRGLAHLDAAGLSASYPAEFAGSTLPTAVILARLVAHFGYHLGQIDLHRRLVTGEAGPIEEPPIRMLEG